MRGFAETQAPKKAQRGIEMPKVLYEKRGEVALITLNRPEKMNALRHQLRRELFHALRVAESDPD